MSLQNINLDPRFTKIIIATKQFAMAPLIVVDVGARGGYEKFWDIWGDQINILGFEADEAECERLNTNKTKMSIRYFPNALDSRKGKRNFYVTGNHASSGFYLPDERFCERLYGDINLAVEKTIQLNTIDFDSFACDNNICAVDFIKLDTEGSELDILKGFIGTLKKSVLGISIEVEFLQLHIQQPVFSDVDAYLRDMGFILFDLSVYRHARKGIPIATSQPNSSPVERGQVIWGQALYLRDGAKEIEGTQIIEAGWNDLRILKLTSIMEMFNLNDCAIELLQVAKRNNYLKNLNIDIYIKELMPDIFNHKKAIAWAKKSVRKILPRTFIPVMYNMLIRTRDFINEIINI